MMYAQHWIGICRAITFRRRSNDLDLAESLAALEPYGLIPVPIGHVAPHTERYSGPIVRPAHKSSMCSCPLRVNAMLLDYSKFVGGCTSKWIRAGSIAFGLDSYCTVRVAFSSLHDGIAVLGANRRATVVRHVAEVMRHVLRIDTALGIEVEILRESPWVHMGLGSTPALQCAVASALNNLLGAPIPSHQMRAVLLNNYAEEIPDDSNRVLRVQAMGAGAAIALDGGGMIVLAGSAIPVARMSIPQTHAFVIALPPGAGIETSVDALYKDVSSYPYLDHYSEDLRNAVAYDVLYRLLPAMTLQDLRTIGQVIQEHRLSDRQIARYFGRYPSCRDGIATLKNLLTTGLAEIGSITSTGPALFVLTREPEEAQIAFADIGWNHVRVRANNNGLLTTSLD